MTKKHFIALADALRKVLYMPPGFVSFSTEQREAILIEMVRFCLSQNTQFNRQRWLDYIAGKCGANGGAIKP